MFFALLGKASKSATIIIIIIIIFIIPTQETHWIVFRHARDLPPQIRLLVVTLLTFTFTTPCYVRFFKANVRIGFFMHKKNIWGILHLHLLLGTRPLFIEIMGRMRDANARSTTHCFFLFFFVFFCFLCFFFCFFLKFPEKKYKRQHRKSRSQSKPSLVRFVLFCLVGGI